MAVWIVIFVLGLVLVALIIRSRPPTPGTAEPLSSVTNDSVLNLSMILMATQAMYGIPVFMVRDKLRISMATAIGLAISPFVYIGAYAVLITVVRSGSVQIDSWVIWPLPVGAGLIVLIGILAIVGNRLHRIERRRSSSRDTVRL
ncbi:MAG: hypothetical protein DCC49_00025 [Acidobacteria bacterium]|nr:MAG: hypothetical protein DCC49_00025 [Acidobacteriota bacterium]